jgi:biopolymer transport protein ExbB
MRSSPSRKLIGALYGGAILLTTPSAYGQPVLQGAPSPATPAPIVARTTQASGGDIALGKRSAAPVMAAGGAAARWPDTTAMEPDTIGPETAARSSPPAGATPAELPRDLTPLGMFVSADIIAKAVMFGLPFASVLTWTVWLAKTFELVAARRRLSRGQRALATAHSVAEADTPASQASPHAALLIEAVEGALNRSPICATSLASRTASWLASSASRPASGVRGTSTRAKESPRRIVFEKVA